MSTRSHSHKCARCRKYFPCSKVACDRSASLCDACFAIVAAEPAPPQAVGQGAREPWHSDEEEETEEACA